MPKHRRIRSAVNVTVTLKYLDNHFPCSIFLMLVLQSLISMMIQSIGGGSM
jgi:hypothetical protein